APSRPANGSTACLSTGCSDPGNPREGARRGGKMRADQCARTRASVKLDVADEHAVGVCVDPVPRGYRDATEIDRDIGAATAQLAAAPRHRRERANADRAGVDLGRIAHAAVHQDAGPAVAFGEDGEVAAEQRAAQAAAAV